MSCELGVEESVTMHETGTGTGGTESSGTYLKVHQA